MMDWDVLEARVLEHGSFHVRFADGLEGVVRFSPSAYRGVFERLRDPDLFNRLCVKEYFVTWPGELDLAPDACMRTSNSPANVFCAKLCAAQSSRCIEPNGTHP